jgi:hypothetical protein
MCAREDMMRSSIANFKIRSTKPELSNVWKIFCKRRRVATGKQLTNTEKELLEWCRQNSVQPIQPAFECLSSPFPLWSHYMNYPPDRLHTLIGGLEMYLSMLALILLQIPIAYPEFKGTKYSDGIGKLDELLKSFPHRQSMPVKTKTFNGGISIYIPSILDNTKKVTGYGSIGLIDSEDVPLLFFQVLFCKHYYKQFYKHFKLLF